MALSPPWPSCLTGYWRKNLRQPNSPFPPKRPWLTYAPSKDAQGRHRWHQTPRSHGGKPIRTPNPFCLPSWPL